MKSNLLKLIASLMLMAWVAADLSAQTTLEIKVFLEGPFSGTEMNTHLNASGSIPLTQPYNTDPWYYAGSENVASIPNTDIVDWVLVELRETDADAVTAWPSTMIAKQAAFLRKDGTIVGLDGTSHLEFSVTITQNLFVVIWHRNHLNILSAVALTEFAGAYTYDFTDDAASAYNGVNAQKELAPGVWGMISGNGTGDNLLDAHDKSDVWKNLAGTSGYKAGDYDLNGQLQNKDKNESWIANKGKVTQVQWWSPCAGTETVDYGGQLYHTIELGSQCWFKENLNIGTMIQGSNGVPNGGPNPMTNNGIIEKYCKDDDPGNCASYGGLYQWEEMMNYNTQLGSQGICPAGWHVPTQTEWNTLTQYIDPSTANIGYKMKSIAGWYVSPNGTGNGNDQFGFTVYPCGTLNTAGNFTQNVTAYWTSSRYGNAPQTYSFYNYQNSIWFNGTDNGIQGYSLRCLKNPNQPPSVPSAPQPSDGSTNQPINSTISWSCTETDNDPLTYDVYFGVSNPPGLFATGVTQSMFDPALLVYSTTYFWKIVAHDDHSNTTEGPVWSFTTLPQPSNQPPSVPSSPSPPNGGPDELISGTFLVWQCFDPENDPLTYDVYFGVSNPPGLFATDITQSMFDPALLVYNTTYFWKIVAHDDHSNTIEGPVWSFSTQSQPFNCGSSLIDNRDGQSYNTVLIGNQCWMAENLDIGTLISGENDMTNNGVLEKYCYDNNISNCDVYGGLYQWDEMMQYEVTEGAKGICPISWHIPTDTEWCIMEQSVDPSITCNSTNYRGTDGGGKIKEAGTSHWQMPNTGATNSSGFAALPGGIRNPFAPSKFAGLTNNAVFSSSTINNSSPWLRQLSSILAQIWRNGGSLTQGYSVRCIKD